MQTEHQSQTEEVKRLSADNARLQQGIADLRVSSRKDSVGLARFEQENAELRKSSRDLARIAGVCRWTTRFWNHFLRVTIEENDLSHLKPPAAIQTSGDHKANATACFNDAKAYAQERGYELVRKEGGFMVVRTTKG